MPCIPGTDTDWINGKEDYIIKGNPALLKSSYCRCKWGGIITITDDGQVDTGSADLSRESAKTEDEMKVESEKKLKVESESVLDGIQLALDAAGLVPGVGAIPDLLNASISALRGDWTAAGLSVLAAVPVIGDAATAAKFAQKGVKAAKAAKKTEMATKTTNIGQPFGTLTARPATTGVNNSVGQPFLSMTAKKEVVEASTTTNTPKLGSLTVDGRKAVTTQSPVAKHTMAEKVVEKKSDSCSEDSFKEIFKYKGNQPKSKDSGNKLDIDS